MMHEWSCSIRRMLAALVCSLALVAVPARWTAAQGQTRKIMIFGGADHKTYLGCLNCARSSRESIFNEAGEYGHCAGALSDNLFCRGPLKEFGSVGPFHDLSACGSSASNPPVIVDELGGYYGRFSVGGVFGHEDAVCSTSIVDRFKNNQTCETVKWVCGN
jgi:hypothetical protein